MKASRVALSRTTPGQSIRSPCRTGASDGISRATKKAAATTTSVGSTNIQCQDRCSAISPAPSMPAMPRR